MNQGLRMNYQEEENNYPKAFLATGIILGVVMALCYFIVFREPPPPPDGTGGILVNYGTVDEGTGTNQASTEEPSVAEKANKQQPNKVNTAPNTEQKTQEDASDKKIVTQDMEDAPTVAANSKKPSKEVSTEPKPTQKPTVNQNALYKGATNKGNGEGDGTTDKPGNQGSKNGSTLSDNYGPGGSGNGLNMPNWTFVSAPDPQNIHRVPGVVVVDFVVDPNGNVISAQYNRSKTRAELSLIQSCIDAIKATKFTSSTPASGNQRGQYTFRFKVD
ncbi:MAG TPA: TonB family protein [Mucilaginibacter sp.]|nr:TonB family protein [Mucilaginibacter sp.]